MEHVLYKLNTRYILQIAQLHVKSRRVIIAFQFMDLHDVDKTMNFIKTVLNAQKYADVDVLINHTYYRNVTDINQIEIPIKYAPPHILLQNLACNLPDVDFCLLLFVDIHPRYLYNNYGAFNTAVKDVHISCNIRNITAGILLFNRNFKKPQELLELLRPITNICRNAEANINYLPIIDNFINNQYLSFDFRLTRVCIKLLTHNVYIIHITELKKYQINNAIIDLQTLPVNKINNFVRTVYELKYTIKIINNFTKHDANYIARKLNYIEKCIPKVTRPTGIIPQTISMEKVRHELTSKLKYVSKIYKKYVDGEKVDFYMNEVVLVLLVKSGNKQQIIIQDYIETLNERRLNKKINNTEYCCFISLASAVDLILNNDTLALAFYIENEQYYDFKPPSYISPNYIAFKCFYDNKNNIIDGNRRKINHAIPLYISDEHWMLAKRYYRNLRGCDYVFVILYKCLENYTENPSEFTVKHIKLLLDITLQLYKIYKPRYRKIVKKFYTGIGGHQTYFYIGLLYTYYEYNKLHNVACAEFCAHPQQTINVEKIIWCSLFCMYYKSNDWYDLLKIKNIVMHLSNRYILDSLTNTYQGNYIRNYNFASLNKITSFIFDIINNINYNDNSTARISNVIINVFDSYVNLNEILNDKIKYVSAALRWVLKTPFQPWKGDSCYVRILQTINYYIIKNIDTTPTLFYFTSGKLIDLLNNNDHCIQNLSVRPGNDIKIIYDLLLAGNSNYKNLFELLKKQNISRKKLKRLINTHSHYLFNLPVTLSHKYHNN